MIRLKATIVLAGVTALCTVSCTGPEKMLAPGPRRSVEVACPVRNPPPGCPGGPFNPTDLTDSNYHAFPVPKWSADYAVGKSATYLPAFPTALDPEELPGPWVCPAVDLNPIFPAWVKGRGLMVFYARGLAVKTADLGMSNIWLGHPRGRFSLPPGWHPSIFPRGYLVSGGTIDGSCFYKMLTNVFTGEPVYVGYVKWEIADNFQIARDFTVNSNDADGVWSSEIGYSYGSSSGAWGGGRSSGGGGGSNSAQAAFTRWLKDGKCTQGWEVWVDGAMVCDGT